MSEERPVLGRYILSRFAPATESSSDDQYEHIDSSMSGIFVQLPGQRLEDSLLFTKIESRLNRTKEYRELFNDFSIPIFEIRKSEAVTRSIEERISIWEYDQNSNACIDYLQIIEKLFIG